MYLLILLKSPVQSDCQLNVCGITTSNWEITVSSLSLYFFPPELPNGSFILGEQVRYLWSMQSFFWYDWLIFWDNYNLMVLSWMQGLLGTRSWNFLSWNAAFIKIAVPAFYTAKWNLVLQKASFFRVGSLWWAWSVIQIVGRYESRRYILLNVYNGSSIKLAHGKWHIHL